MKKYNSIHFIGTSTKSEDAIDIANKSFKNFQEPLENLNGEIFSVNTNLIIDINIHEKYIYTILITYFIYK